MKSLCCLFILIFAFTCGSQAQVGRKIPAEWQDYRDNITGIQITALTTHPGKDNKIYQTHPNWSSDGKHIIFISDRGGTNQYYAVSTINGEITQLTDDSSPSQACLSRNKNSMLYIAENAVWELDLDKILSEQIFRQSVLRKEVAQLPENFELSGSMSLDSDGNTLYLGVKYNEEAYGLVALNLNLGSLDKILDLNFRIGHCQAHPLIPGLIMYCWETGGDSDQRMWLTKADGRENEPFYKKTFNEWVTHEVWWGSRKALFTIWPKNELMLAQPHGIAWVSLEDRSLHVLDAKKYWHVGAGPDGKWAVGDTFEGDLWLIEGDSGEAKLLTAGHRLKGNTVHPHPSFSPDGRQVLFCSEKNGNWDLFLTESLIWEKLK
jgi:oligogalacturonide lyase